MQEAGPVSLKGQGRAWLTPLNQEVQVDASTPRHTATLGPPGRAPVTPAGLPRPTLRDIVQMRLSVS